PRATPLGVVLNELVQNAVEHGLGGGAGTVTVDLDGGGDTPIVLEVHDNGAGRTRQATPGTGLGLRLVRALVEEELSGQFTLSHPAGRGTTAPPTTPPVDGRPEPP